MDLETLCQPFLLSMLSAAMAQLSAFVGLLLKQRTKLEKLGEG
jgi:hypothetical protein